MADPRPFALPPRARRDDGGIRRLGVEIEFAGLEPQAIARAVGSAVGGAATELSAAEWLVQGSRIGDVRIELDARIVRELARDAASEAVPDWLADVAERASELAERATSLLLPWEVVTAPVELTQLHEVENIFSALRRAGALGTRHAPHYAFGVHLNPELPSLDGEVLLAHFKAFLCLKDWLRERCRPTLSRQLSPFIRDFDDGWVREIVDPAYWPSREAFCDEYLRANPSRNRILDLLPLLSEIDGARVAAVVDDPLVKPRPTFHYRLPNSEIDEPAFTLEALWDDWLQVERLAEDPERLETVALAYQRWLSKLRLPFDDGWAREVEQWL